VRTPAWLGALALILVSSASSPLRADGPSNTGAVVARVGGRTITAAELERRIAQVPPFQLRSFGKSLDEIRRNFLERVLVREILMSQGAEADKLDERDDVRERIRGVLRTSVLGRIRQEAATGGGVTDEEIKAYYEANPIKFHAPARVAIWRIQLATKAEAKQVLDEVAKEKTPKKWNDIARERSLDKTTSLRGGNLGFVGPDGATAEPGIKVDPSLYAAALAVSDAEMVNEPVKDGDHFSVVWRRQSMKAVDRTIEQESVAIRQILMHQKVEDRVNSVLDRLKKEQVNDLHAELVDVLEIGSTGDVHAARRPGSLPMGRTKATPAPKEGAGGLR
jgi:peptidyl-prolyl cis-trans isomerase C